MVSTNSWIQILSAASGTGNATVSYRVLSNNTALVRGGILDVAGGKFTVTQSGAACPGAASKM